MRFYKLFYSVLKYIPEGQQERGKDILAGIIKDARQYLIGNLILVAVLTIIYSIGFSISGMKSPFTTAFLAGIFILSFLCWNPVGRHYYCRFGLYYCRKS